ncbi:MAG TPA: T9SS type A sorting domain-containing protein [Ignavibacteria bacterium]|nr:T9SS type A sorting domain-containing protein [Ignavibacteria bacterium]
MIFFTVGSVYSQENVRIMSYNILNYPGSDANTRNPYFRTIIRNSNPDVLVVGEMQSQAGMDNFLNNVLNQTGSQWSAGTFINGPDTDNGIFFKTGKFIFLGNRVIQTALRDINEFKIIHVNYPMDTLRIYAVHLKASEGSANELQRAAEVDSLRKITNQLSVNSCYLVCGDFNIYGATESAYQKLLQVNGNQQGHFVDALNMPGTWNIPSYAIYHTQSPRVRAFGGGSNGGMDDRFDMILYSNAMATNGRIIYVNNSLTPYGNDGQHYNDSINKRPNLAVADSIADALHYAADHIPVFATFKFGNPMSINPISSTQPEKFNLYQNYPNPFNPATHIKFDLTTNAYVKLTIFDILGRIADVPVNKHLNSGSYEVNWNANNLSSGMYFYKLEVFAQDGMSMKFVQSKSMMLVK